MAWKRVPKANSVCSSYSNSSFSDTTSTYTTISNRSIGKSQVSPGMTPTVPKLVKITKPLGIFMIMKKDIYLWKFPDIFFVK